MKSRLGIFLVGLVFFPSPSQAEQATLRPGSLICKSYQDVVLAREKLKNDPQFASNTLNRTGRCVSGNPYQEQIIQIIGARNQGYEIQFYNNPDRYWVLKESVKNRERTSVADEKRWIIYPASGQSMNELLTDKSECRLNAMQKSGFDPRAPASDSSYTIVPPPIYSSRTSGFGSGEAGQGGVLDDAAGGAALGAIGGAIAGDAGTGAGIGAVAGALFGGIVRAERHVEEQEWQRQYQTMQAYQMQEQNQQSFTSKKQYDFIFKRCMENLGYKVK